MLERSILVGNIVLGLAIGEIINHIFEIVHKLKVKR